MPRSASGLLGTRPHQPGLAQLDRAMDEVSLLLAPGAGSRAVHGSGPGSNSCQLHFRTLVSRKLSRGTGDCGPRGSRSL